MTTEIKIEKLATTGQGLGTLADGKKVFVWNSLPGETVEVEMTSEKKSFGEGIATKVLKASKDRVVPQDVAAYLSTSPWQIMTGKAESVAKQTLLAEVFSQVGRGVEFDSFADAEPRYNYRGKMEYSFWWNASEKKVRLAHFARGSHERIVVDGSALAHPAINAAGVKLIEFIAKHDIPSRELKSVIIRTTAAGEVHIVLYVINDRLAVLPWAEIGVAGLKLVAARRNSDDPSTMRPLGQVGADTMTDMLLGHEFEYAPDGFFQIHLPAYEMVLADIKKFVDSTAGVVDLYAGVGSIGMSVTDGPLVCVESDKISAAFAKKNLSDRKDARIVDASSESSLDEIVSSCTLVVDPPRAGLHQKVIARIADQRPKMVVYLSCNPATQVRDINDLVAFGYSVKYARGYNFFPTTPHIESLVILELS
jgi:23S rRNA (uracil1939-C5)-methyltransferase